MSHPILGPVLGFANRLRFPTLFFITAALFVVDLLIPDFIPFADELLLGLATILLANWKSRRPPEARPSIEGEARKP
jgi:hypothetical protein